MAWWVLARHCMHSNNSSPLEGLDELLRTPFQDTGEVRRVENRQCPIKSSCSFFSSIIQLYLWVTSRAVIGQFSGPYSAIRSGKIKAVFLLPKCFVIYRQVFLTLTSSKSRRPSFTLSWNLLVLLSTCVRNLKSFRVSRNSFWTQQTHSRDTINTSITSSSWSYFKLRVWAINRREKKLGPKSLIVRPQKPKVYLILKWSKWEFPWK